jgi:heat-inducible transcriptional repressor
MITERQKQVLKNIVEEYIKTAEPVGSKNICKKLNCSSATIRNDMAVLERMGYIEKTHISSGRIPSEVGYRYYVDDLMEPSKMTGEDMLKLQTIFHNNSLELSDVIKKSIEVISEITNYTSVVLGSSAKENKLKKIEVVPIEEEKIIALIVTDKGHVEHKSINVQNISINEVKKTVEVMNDLLVGTPLNEVNTKLEFEIKPIISKYVRQHELLYEAFYNAFSEFSKKYDTHFAGKTNFLGLPEFNTIDKVKNIISKFEDEELINNIEATPNGINIYIGKENKVDEDLAVITTKYVIDGKEETIAVIGPKRMEYNRVVSLLEYIKNNIGG